MIRIPFDRCVILTTLNFIQITDRLESAIYDPRFPLLPTDNRDLKYQFYFGQIRGFKFLANRIIGSKYLHLPIFLAPTIVGDICSLPHGYEISLTVRLNNVTFALLLTWLGGLLTTISSMLDNILVDSKNYQYFTNIQIAILLYLAVILYLYFDAWQATKFFKTLFAQGFVGNNQSAIVHLPKENSVLQNRRVGNFTRRDPRIQKSATDCLNANLPSFSVSPRK